MTKRVLAAALVLGLMVPAHAAQIQGAGARTCSMFMSDISAGKIVGAEDIYINWALGYISRINMQAESDGRGTIDLTPGSVTLREQKAYVRQYCSNNPGDLYEGAARALYNHLKTLNGAGV